jgi:predicted DNA-binding protein YlxM (UPF0122 family)
MSTKNPLAYGRVIDKIKLPEQYHKFKKIMNKDRQEIRKLYSTGDYSYRVLANKYNVSYGVIQCIINPIAKKQQLEASKRWRIKTNYKHHLADCMELRKRKKKLIQQNIIIL